MRKSEFLLVVVRLIFALEILPSCFTLTVNISNVLERLDVNGNPMDIHDGNIIQFQTAGLYYYYGVGYGQCHSVLDFGCAGEFLIGDCGFRTNHTINLYTSPDLVRWTFVRDVLPWTGGRPLGIYYRPKVIYNRWTKLYVLWVNRVQRTGPFDVPDFRKASYVVATSKTPEGPFSVSRTEVENLVYGNPGDFSLFVDETNSTEIPQAYIAYDAFDNLHRIQIEQLTADYTESLGRAATTGPLSPVNNESPILFKRHNYYYLLFGECCCFCRSGSNSRVFVSSHPLGPWYDTHNDIDPVSEHFVNGTFHRRSISGGQESFIIEALKNDSTIEYIFVSDRWGTGLYKSDDKQYWQPLVFNDTQTPARIQIIHWVDEFTLNLAVTNATVTTLF